MIFCACLLLIISLCSWNGFVWGGSLDPQLKNMNQALQEKIPQEQQDPDSIDQDLLKALEGKIAEYDTFFEKSDTPSTDLMPKDLDPKSALAEQKELMVKYVEILERRIQRALDHPNITLQDQKQLEIFKTKIKDLLNQLHTTSMDQT
jgi:hypothetical protein